MEGIDKRLACYESLLAFSGDNWFIQSHVKKSPEEYRITRALYVMLVNHLSHHIMYVQQTVPVRHSCGDEHHCPLLTALNALIRCLCWKEVELCRKADESLPQRMQTGETQIFCPLKQGCMFTLKSSEIKTQWHNNWNTTLLWPVIIRINPPYRHFQQLARLREAATKLEHNLPQGPRRRERRDQ